MEQLDLLTERYIINRFVSMPKLFDTIGIVSPTILEIGSSSLFLNMTSGVMNFRVLWVGELFA